MIVLEKNFDRPYFLKSGNCFFSRFANTMFKEEWNGLWMKNFKFIDYFAFKINNEWLSWENIEKFVFEEKIAKSYFKLKDQKVIEKIYLIQNTLFIEVFCEKESEILIEIGINFRHFNENKEKEYKIKNDDKVIVSYNEKFLCLTSEPIGNITNYFYKEHYPSQKRFKIFVVWYKVNSNQAKFKISVGSEIEALFPSEKEEEKTYFEFYCDDNKITELAKISIENIKFLIFDSEFFSGLPYSPFFEPKKFLKSISGILYSGYFEEAKKCILKVFDSLTNDLETQILLINALWKYYNHTGDFEIIRNKKVEIKNIIENVINKFENKESEEFQEFLFNSIKILKRLNLEYQKLMNFIKKIERKNFVKERLNEIYENIKNKFIYLIPDNFANPKNLIDLFSSSLILEYILKKFICIEFFAETNTIILTPLVNEFYLKTRFKDDIIKIYYSKSKIKIESKNKKRYNIVFKPLL